MLPIARAAGLLALTATLSACLDWNGARGAPRDAAPDADAALDADSARDDAGVDAPPDDAAAEDASAQPVEDADAPPPTLDAADPDASSHPGACPADGCPELFPCAGSANDYYCDGQYAEFPLPSRRAGDSEAAQQLVVDRDAGTVLDEVTGLMWERTWLTTPVTQPEASEYCNTLALGGFSDFRLPSVHEVITLYGAEVGPELDSRFFQNVGYSVSYWLRTPWVEGNGDGLTMFFMEYGLTSWNPGEYRAVVCVRTHAHKAHGTPDARFALEADDTLVADTHTGLRWERNLPLGRTEQTWAQAAEHCAQLGLGGRQFRLPSVAELLSIYDFGKLSGARLPAELTGRSASMWTRTAVPPSGDPGEVPSHRTVGTAGFIGTLGSADTDRAASRCVSAP